MADVKVNVGVETGNSVNNVNQLAEAYKKCTERVVELQEAGDIQGAALAAKQAYDLKRTLQLEEREQTIGQSQNQGSFTRMINQGTSTLGNLMGGNIGGAAQGLASLVTGIGKFAGIGAIVGGGLMLANKASESYENSLDTIQGLGRAYNKNVLEPTIADRKKMATEGKTYSDEDHYKANNFVAMSFYKNLKDNANRVGMAIDDFANAVTEMAKNGIENIGEAKGLTERSAEFKQGTGADLNVLTGFAGLTKRYGNENNALDTAYRGLTASGMNRNQYQEYLQAVQGIIENGIENGFVASTEDVSKTLAMLAKSSGDNELWKGQQGANRLAKVNSGFSSATELQNTSQVLLYQAIANTQGNPSSYVDVMKEMEHGIDSIADAKSLADLLEKQYGDNEAGKIEELRNMFGLSYNDSDSFLKILDKVQEGGYTEEQYKKDAIDFSSIKTPQEKQLAVQNELKTIAVEMGQGVFEIKYMLGNKFLRNSDKSDKEIEGYKGFENWTEDQIYNYRKLRSEGVSEANALVGIGETEKAVEKVYGDIRSNENLYGTMTGSVYNLIDQDGKINTKIAKQYDEYVANDGKDSIETYYNNVMGETVKNYQQYMAESQRNGLVDKWKSEDRKNNLAIGEQGGQFNQGSLMNLSLAVAEGIRLVGNESINVNMQS